MSQNIWNLLNNIMGGPHWAPGEGEASYCVPRRLPRQGINNGKGRRMEG